MLPASFTFISIQPPGDTFFPFKTAINKYSSPLSSVFLRLYWKSTLYFKPVCNSIQATTSFKLELGKIGGFSLWSSSMTTIKLVNTPLVKFTVVATVHGGFKSYSFLDHGGNHFISYYCVTPPYT